LFFKRRKITRSEVLGPGIDEIHEASTAVELGKEDGGVTLGLGALDPLQARSNAAALAASFPQHTASIATHPHLCSTLVKLPLSSSVSFDYTSGVFALLWKFRREWDGRERNEVRKDI
jgi:hypothetical protein